MARALPTQNSMQSQPSSRAGGACVFAVIVATRASTCDAVSSSNPAKKDASSSTSQSNDGAANNTGWYWVMS